MPHSPIGRPIRVGLFEHGSDAFKCFRSLPKHCTKPGAEIEIVAMVMKLLDWDWEVVDTAQVFGTSDFGVLQDNGSYSGLLGLLANEKIDMSGLSIRVTPDRMKFVHFTFPTRYFQQVYIIRKPPDADFRNFIFSTFSLEIWFLLLATIVGVALFRFLVNVFVLKHKGPKSSIASRSLLETYAMMVRQKIPNVDLLSGMIVEATIILVTMVLYIYYQSSMNSKLTAPSLTAIPFRHQSQLIELLEHHKTYLTYFNGLPLLEGSTKKNTRRLKKLSTTNPTVVHSDSEELNAEIKRGGVFFSSYDIEFLPAPISTWNKNEGLTVIRDTTGITSYVAYGFSRKNKALCNQFNKALLRILPGIPRINSNPGYAQKKEAEDLTIKARTTSLSLRRHLEQLFELYMIGMGICIFAFFSERLVDRFWRSRIEQTYVVAEEGTNIERIRDFVRKVSTSTLRRIDRLDSTNTLEISQRGAISELEAIPEDDNDSIFTNDNISSSQ
ncbi:unnamed protein product, partial [Mesorhabditis belari]|uniref:Solute-binding protein family 3/N-terminal domain-containing protein n=1 Tax=Mesorhabditis belari TaxID=2138241 RepID=A0AAF3EZF1_9BILA